MDISTTAIGMRVAGVAVLAFVPLGSSGCYEDDGYAYSDLEVNCLDIRCPWIPDDGAPAFGTTWHDGDIGVDLSAPGRNAASMKVVLIARNSRQFDLNAAVYRDGGVQLHIDFDFYAAPTGMGATFWDQSPTFLSTERVDAESTGAYVLHRHVDVPSESAAFIIHLVKEGEGRAFIDELTVGHIDYVRTL